MRSATTLLLLLTLGWGGCENEPKVSSPLEKVPPVNKHSQASSTAPELIDKKVDSHQFNTWAQKEGFCRAIMDQLWQASDHWYGNKKPELLLSKAVNCAGSYKHYPNSDTIDIEEKAFKICLSLGPNHFRHALAFIIAHELAHHFQQIPGHTAFHGEKCGFLSYDHKVLALTADEKNADLSGAFNMYLAGMPLASANTLDTLFKALYVGYHLPDIDPTNRYPPKDERIQTAQLVLRQLKELIALYNGAAIFSAIGADDAAVQALETVLKSYQGQEVYANLGIAEARKALKLKAERNDKWKHLLFPLENDWDSKMKRAFPFMSGSPDPQHWLKLAEEHLKKALLLNPNYHLAALNLFLVKTMNDTPLHDVVETFDQINKRPGWPKSYRLSATLALGNAYHLRGKNETTSNAADSLWQLVANGQEEEHLAEMAKFNMAMKKNSETNASDISPKPLLPPQISPDAAVDGVNLDIFPQNKVMPTALVPTMTGLYEELPGSSVLYLNIAGTKISLQQIRLKEGVVAKVGARELRLSSGGSIVVVPSVKIGYRTHNGNIIEYFKYRIFN